MGHGRITDVRVPDGPAVRRLPAAVGSPRQRAAARTVRDELSRS